MPPVGPCHLCGNVRPLTREHVPPREAFNRGSYLQVLPDVAIQTGPEEIPEGRTQQGGIWYYRMCNLCNTFCGRRYAPEYIRWANGMLRLLNQWPEGAVGVAITAERFFPLRLIKEVASMFLTVNPIDFRNSPVGTQLAQFVQEREAVGIPPGLQFFGYLNREGQFRRFPFGTNINLFTGYVGRISEIAHPPCGWVMTHDSDPPDERLAEITTFGDIPYDTNATVEVWMPRLPTYLVMPPGDYRTLEELNEHERRQYEAERAEAERVIAEAGELGREN